MRIDPNRLLNSFVVAVVLALLMVRPWPGQTDGGDLWGLLGGVLGAWAVAYRAWPAIIGMSPRLVLPRMLPGVALGVLIAAVVPGLVIRLTGWSEGTAALLILAVGAVVVAVSLAIELRRRHPA